MEIIQIKSAHSLVTSVTDARPPGAHAYRLNCRQFLSAYKNWRNLSQTPPRPLGVMTLDFERIWITEAESTQLANAIQAATSPVVFE